MTRIQAVNPETATGKTKELLDDVKAKVGFVPNLMSTLAVSPVALEAYLQLSGTLSRTLDAKSRELISLAVAETNGCEYCAAAHSTLGKMVGLTPDDILNARRGTAKNPKHRAVVELAKTATLTRGKISQADYDDAIGAGLDEREITEIIANVALNVFTNTFNNVAGTPIDFPAIEPLEA